MLTNEIPLPTNEAGRLAILRHYQILDTEPEPAFDDLARLAAFCCQTPIALINFVDQQRVWSKALVNFPYPELPRELSACTYAILQNDLCIVPDALLDARFTTNPLVTAPAGLRFYAGVPLYTPEGYAIGTLCVMDLTPRQLTAEQQDALRALARQVPVADDIAAFRRVGLFRKSGRCPLGPFALLRTDSTQPDDVLVLR